MTVPEITLAGSYDYRLVMLSVIIAIFASFSALDLAGRVASARGLTRVNWLGGGAIAMGVGIWSMHYVGMLAFRLPVTVLYDWPTVMASLLAAIFASAAALLFTIRQKASFLHITVGSIFMGSGIAGMHYIGMASMRLPAMCHYSSRLVGISVVEAVAISWVAIWVSLHFREDKDYPVWKKAASAAIMGSAIPAMHYTGMAAAHFTPAPLPSGGLNYALSATAMGTVSIVAATILIQGLAILTSLFDRLISLKKRDLEFAESRARRILDTAFDAFVEMDTDERITNWNAQAERMFNRSVKDVVGKTFAETIIPESRRKLYLENVQKLCRCDLRQTQNLRFETRVLSGAGREIPAEITISATCRVNGCYFAAFVRDLSKRERAEAKFQDLLESFSEATIIVNSEGLIVVCNSRAATLFGYTRTELIGHNLEMLLPERSRGIHPSHRNFFFHDPRIRPMGAGLDLFAKRKDGTEFPVEISLSPLHAEEGIASLRSDYRCH